MPHLHEIRIFIETPSSKTLSSSSSMACECRRHCVFAAVAFVPNYTLCQPNAAAYSGCRPLAVQCACAAHRQHKLPLPPLPPPPIYISRSPRRRLWLTAPCDDARSVMCDVAFVCGGSLTGAKFNFLSEVSYKLSHKNTFVC